MTIVVEEFPEITVHWMFRGRSCGVSNAQCEADKWDQHGGSCEQYSSHVVPFRQFWGPKRAPPNAHKPKPVASRGSEPSRALQVLPHIQVRTGFTFFLCYECPRPPVRCSTAHLRDTRASRR